MERKSQNKQGAKIIKTITQTERIRCLEENIHLEKQQQNFQFWNSQEKDLIQKFVHLQPEKRQITMQQPEAPVGN